MRFDRDRHSRGGREDRNPRNRRNSGDDRGPQNRRDPRDGRDDRNQWVQRDRPFLQGPEPGIARVFTGIPLSQDLIRKIEKKVNLLDPFGKSLRWVSFNTAHLTLHFFARLDEKKLPLLKEITENTAVSVKPFTLSLAKAGFFPSERMPRVFCWGLNPSKDLEELHRRLTARYRKENFPLEARQFKAHITLGRFRDPVTINRDMVVQLERVWELKGSAFRADHLRMFKSPAGPDGYETIQKFPFKG